MFLNAIVLREDAISFLYTTWANIGLVRLVRRRPQLARCALPQWRLVDLALGVDVPADLEHDLGILRPDKELRDGLLTA